MLALLQLVAALGLWRVEDTQSLSVSGRVIPRSAAIADVATADADVAYGQAEADLINELKTKLNSVLATMRARGDIAP